eukprot:NODE_190_length_13461_cov_0.525595.p7 type:complete len:256 gc:universal NODE_190_length_13461_cov_0.525595:5681-4914(-)
MQHTLQCDYDSEDELQLILSIQHAQHQIISSFASLNEDVPEEKRTRGPKIYNRVHKMDPIDCINEGMSSKEFKRLFRLSPVGFFKFFEIIKDIYLQQSFKTETRGRPITPITLRIGMGLFYFGHSIDYVALANFFGVSETTAFKSVIQFSEYLILLEPFFVYLPSLNHEMQDLEDGMNVFTELKGAIGCLDGCHIPIKLPKSADPTSFYCFKSFYSHLVVVLCDFKYRILGYSIGHSGNKADSTVVFYIYLDQIF